MENAKDLFVGRLGIDPELRYTKGQEPVCYLTVAVNKEDQDKAIWKKVIVWGEQALHCNLYLKKGTEIFVQGRVNKIPFTNKEGLRTFYEEVNARLIGFSFMGN